MMAKKKVSAKPSSKEKSTKPMSSTHGGKKAMAPKAKPPMRVLDNPEIGEVAGEVWRFLEAEGAQTISTIKKGIVAPGDVVAAAIGWLAREDKLVFRKSGRTVKVCLR